MSPRIAFCTTCKGRAQHLKLTLPKNLVDNESYANSVFVIVDYGSRDDLIPWLIESHSGDIDRGKVVLYQFDADGPFKMAHAKNLAHRAGIAEGADILVNLDADNFTGVDFASYLAHEFTHYPHQFFMWANMVKGEMSRGISGRIAVTRNAFLKVGGYDERFNTWAPDDKDFNLRLRHGGYEPREIERRFLDSVRHNDKMRFKEYPHAKGMPYLWNLAGAMVKETSVVNFGAFGLGELRRNFADVVTFGILPTRVFGIGMHKTGTTSLHEAFKLLGFESVHWPSAHWAKAVWTQMRADQRSPSLERYYAATDLPITLLYRELDQAYPHSKFVLTVRGEESWLSSVERHFSYDHNPFRAVWDADPFTHFIHREVYGRKTFDREIFLTRYREHNAAVQDYFKHDPQKLLILHAHKWAPLCQFLIAPTPSVHYPHANGQK